MIEAADLESFALGIPQVIPDGFYPTDEDQQRTWLQAVALSARKFPSWDAKTRTLINSRVMITAEYLEASSGDPYAFGLVVAVGEEAVKVNGVCTSTRDSEGKRPTDYLDEDEAMQSDPDDFRAAFWLAETVSIPFDHRMKTLANVKWEHIYDAWQKLYRTLKVDQKANPTGSVSVDEVNKLVSETNFQLAS